MVLEEMKRQHDGRGNCENRSAASVRSWCGLRKETTQRMRIILSKEGRSEERPGVGTTP